MKYLAPLLDVILGMLLAFISIAAVSGKAEEAGADDDGGRPPEIDPVVLELRLDRVPSASDLLVRDEDGGTYRPLAGIEALSLDAVDEVELTVRDGDLYDLLRDLEQRGRAPKVLFEKQ